MNIIEIEKKLNRLVENFNKETFIFTLLEAYDFTKTTIARAKKGSLNKLEVDGSFTIKKKLYFLQTQNDVHLEIDSIKKTILDKKDKPRFIIVTDYTTLLAYDTKTDDSLDIPTLELDRHYDFFLPWVGMEKSQYLAENPADIKAAAKMAKLYDEILKVNALETAEDRHYLNVFLTRLLFCYFAEDTNIFPEGIFTHSIESHTKLDGSNLDNYLERLFEILNTEEDKRPKNTPAYLDKFPYVNGGLFRDSYPIPPFTAKARKILIEVGKLQWSEINPDIFGSMVQAVIAPEHRAGLGMHYTSVPNIMKVINPLFLDELYEEFDKSFENVKKLRELIERVSKIKVFDPACGSGNFLIIAYKKLRELEIAILQRIDVLSAPQRSMDTSQIRLDNFYGIEIDDFAHEVAILSMWLVEHQMNLKFYEAFGRTSPTLPLKAGGNIVAGNATRLDWEEVCPKNSDDEIYLLGNPPYVGGKSQTKLQKIDMQYAFNKAKNIGELDYIACWFIKASHYINKNSSFCFVSTSSICQGSQVQQLWPKILSIGLEINFAYNPFKWKNNAKNNAGVIVSIICVSYPKQSKNKFIIDQNIKKNVKNINPYLIEGKNTIIYQSLKPISKLPTILTGNSPYDGGNLILNQREKDDLLSRNPEAKKYIKNIRGSQDFINGKSRWCLWIRSNDINDALKINFIKDRVTKTRVFRENGGTVAKGLIKKPFQFRYIHEAKNNLIILPRVSSERRKYIPFGFLSKDYIVSDSAQVIYDPEPYILGVIMSLMHMSWVKKTGGYLGTSIRYSSAPCYNTFPFPDISQKQKDTITELVFNILDEREKHSEKTLAQLYDPDKMPAGLREAHHRLDLAIEQCYRKKPFESDEERLEYLFKMYEKMVGDEK